MHKIAVYGKGGIGKSTVSANISAGNALAGKRVLHVGCDPKRDSTLSLIVDKRPKTVAELLLLNRDRIFSVESFLVHGKMGIDLVEAGGPEPGIGCAGRGIARMFDTFEEFGLLSDDKYDLALFDVLGDVVCGGFAAPLRRKYADLVVIVISEEIMSLYAANNICRAIVRFQKNGLRLAGMIVNRRDNSVFLQQVEDFASAINAKILATIPRDPLIRKAEMSGQTLMEFAPDSDTAKLFADLSNKLFEMENNTGTVPTPMDDDGFQEFISRYVDKD